jgi:NifU-like protein involved in Fe-S cluster formation
MNEVVLKYYRRLLRNGFEYTGSIEDPSIFLDSIGENLPICGKIGRDYLHLFISVKDGIFEDIKYLCTCDPTANVVFEILCFLTKGKSLDEVKALTAQSFINALGAEDPDFVKKAAGAVELVGRGISRYLQDRPAK